VTASLCTRLGLLTLLSLTQFAPAQVVIQTRPRAAAECSRSVASLRADKNLVLVPVSVLDYHNHPVTSLVKNNFRVFEDNAERPIEDFSREDAPVAVGIVFDSSGSMGRKLSDARQAVKAFFETANSGDEFLLVEFNSTPKVTIPLTRDTQEIESRLGSAESKGRTALLDAVYLALQEVRKSSLQRKALLIVSDGGDNHSRYREREIRELIRESDVLIYAAGIYEPMDLIEGTPEEMAGPALLKEIAEQSGGREFSVASMSELGSAMSVISDALRNQYMLGFSPAARQGDGRFHKVKVKIAWRHWPLPFVSWRLGYYANQD
jgi:Ca-activated chloride channel homolog